MYAAHLVLVGMGSKLDGLRWEATDSLRIGRQPSADVVLRDHSVERLHAEVKYCGSRWIVRDLAGSEHYPMLVNGVCLQGGQRELHEHDVLQIGRVLIRVATLRTSSQLEDPVAPQPRPGATPVLPIIRSANGVFSADLQIQAVAERSWDRAIELIAADCKPRQGRALVSLLRANQHLSRFSTLADLVQAILEEALAGLRAQRGALLLADPQTQKLDVKAVLAPTVAAQAKSHLPTLADRCFRDGQSILCQDVHTDPGMVAARSVPLDGMASVLCVLLRTPSRRLGVLHLDRGPLQEPFTESDLALADALAASVAVGIECAQVIEAQQREFTETVTTLAQAMEARDRYSGGHTKRVTDYALVLAAELNLPAPERRQLQAAGPLYDIGKIGIDDAILRKPGKLTPGEFEAMKSHTVMGAAMLEGISTMKSVVPIVRHHHERWDGTGYPDGLGHEQIALSARIMAVADAFDAMTSTRPYRAALPVQLAFREILNKAGAHFDPDCVQAFLRAHHRVDKLLTAHAIEALPSTTVCPVTVG